MNKKTAITLMLISLISGLSISSEVCSFELPKKDAARKFFENTDVSLTPVYGIMNNPDDHVATVHGFFDNLEVCQVIVELLSKDGHIYICVKLNDGVLK